MFVPLLASKAAELPFAIKALAPSILQTLKKGRVSVIIPAYNRLHYLKLAVGAVLLQTYDDIEVVISQNPKPEGLDPDIRDWAATLAARNPKVRYYANQSDLGISGNYKACLSRVTGQYTIIIGDDDILLPDCVEKMMAASASGADVIFCNRFLIDEQGYRRFGEHVRFDNGYLLSTGIVPDAEKVAWLNLVLLSGAAVRTTSLLAVGFSPDNNLEDFALFVKLAALGQKFYFINDLLVEFRVHTTSATGSGSGTFHHLLKHIIPIQVKPENESLKGKFISYLAGPAVNQSLQENNIPLAKYLLSSHYYPRRQHMRFVRMFQLALTQSPSPFIRAFFRIRKRIKKRFK